MLRLLPISLRSWPFLLKLCGGAQAQDKSTRVALGLATRRPWRADSGRPGQLHARGATSFLAAPVACRPASRRARVASAQSDPAGNTIPTGRTL